MRHILLYILLFTTGAVTYAQPDTTQAMPVDSVSLSILLADTNSIAYKQHRSDSLSMLYIKKPDPGRHNKFTEEILKKYLYTGYAYLDIHEKPDKQHLQKGTTRKTRDSWVVGLIIGILIYGGIIRLGIAKDVQNMMQTFANKQLFSQADSEGFNLLSFRGFLALLLFAGLTFGLLAYQLLVYSHFSYQFSGFTLYAIISGVIILLIVLKLLLLKFLGFVFNISEITYRYIIILCYTYFTLSFLALLAAICMSLVNAQLISGVLSLTGILALIVLVWLYLRCSVILVSSIRISKFYLFVYLCALEICPIIVLIKALSV